jgi:cation diffusion facilitator CzcD-associated flavoprotein CzcO/acetyl esterase/lipase
MQRAITDRAAIVGSSPRSVRHSPRPVGGVAGEWVEPEQSSGPGCVLYLHGGGHVLGSAASHRNVVAHLVDQVGVPAFVPNYRLAPEHRWPAALDDAVAAYLALGRTRPGDPIAVVGDSAGGGLALSLAMALRDRGAPAPAMIAMICPWLDLASPRDPCQRDGVLDTSALERWADAYAPRRADRSDPAVSPLLGELAGLPPLVVHCGSLDPLVEDARQLDGRARDAGVDITTTEYPGLWHDFHLFAGRLRDADRAMTHLAAQLSRYVGARRDPRVVVIGAGMSGLCMGAKLRDAGMSNFTILEKAADIGGTWRENTYPGLSCDVPSRFYSYSFLPNPSWTSVFSPGAEIQNYFQRATDELELRSHIELGAEVDDARWTGDEWEVVAADGRRWSADVLVTATGVLHHPRLPHVDGLESFRGAAFHSARWDHSVPLEGRRVAVIGTGSTGAQIVTALASDVEQLYVLQRSAQWILPVPNRRYSERTQRLLARLPMLNRTSYRAYRFVLGTVFARATTQPGIARRAISAACRWNLRLGVRDADLRRVVTPDHRPMCRRLIMSAGYYPAIQRPNVEVITSGIERFEPSGVRLNDGRLLEVDVVVMATGFDAHAYMRPIKISGLEGRTLEEEWAEGPRGYRTIALPGFPNLFTLMGPHSPVGNHSLIAVAEAQADYIIAWLMEMRRGELRAVAPSRPATEAFNAEIRDAMPKTIWTSGCTSWYLGKDGLPELWPWTPERHRSMLRGLHVEEFEVFSASAPAV